MEIESGKREKRGENEEGGGRGEKVGLRVKWKVRVARNECQREIDLE